MTRYNFDELTDQDFESLVADLVQKEFGLRLEVFTPGPDKGVDARYLRAKGGAALIVQCKKYKPDGFAALKRIIRTKEKTNLASLTPARYILATSVNLTVGNKAKLAVELSPWLISESDILGRDDLVTLLRKFPEVERSHTKLWLTSTEVLEAVLNNDVRNRTDVTLEQISSKLKIWVPNPSMAEARDLLDQHGVCVIAGPPGVGKSLLAEVLLAIFSAEKYEPVVINDDLDEAFRVFNKTQKQIFYLDDFLGRVHLESSPLRKNEDTNIIKFFQLVSRSANHKMILTTREYILADARQRYERLEDAHFPEITYVLNLDRYTRPIRAQILYNHLYYSKLPKGAIDDILKGRRYWKIIDHANYSPRLIEHVVGLRTDWSGNSLFEMFATALDNPSQLWLRIFEELPEVSRVVLMTMITLNRDAELSVLERSARAAEGTTSLDTVAFEHALRGLEGTFLSVRQSTAFDREGEAGRLVSFSNPSIVDFLWEWLKTHRGTLARMFSRSLYFAQKMRILMSPIADSEGKISFLNSVGLSQEQVAESLLASIVGTPMTNPQSFVHVVFPDEKRFGFTPDSRLCSICQYLQDLPLESVTTSLLSNAALKRSTEWTASSVTKAEVLALIRQVESMELLVDEQRTKFVASCKSFYMDDVESLDDADFLGELYGLLSEDFTLDEEVLCVDIVQQILDNLDDEWDNAGDAEDIQDIAERVGNLGEYFGISVEQYLFDVDERVDAFREAPDENEPDWESDKSHNSNSYDVREIDSMFDSLRFASEK